MKPFRSGIEGLHSDPPLHLGSPASARPVSSEVTELVSGCGIFGGPGGDELEQSEAHDQHDDDGEQAPSRQDAAEDGKRAVIARPKMCSPLRCRRINPQALRARSDPAAACPAPDVTRCTYVATEPPLPGMVGEIEDE